MKNFFLLFLSISVFLIGCGSSPEVLDIYVESEPDTNQKMPLQMVVRAVDVNSYYVETYETIADKIFIKPPDPSYLVTEVIYPGKEHKITVEQPEKLPVAIYFMFNNPGEKWKTIVLGQPGSIEIELEKNQIKAQY